MRLWLAIKCFFLILLFRRLPPDAAALLPAPKPGQLPPREAEIVDAAITRTVPGEPALDATQPMAAPAPTPASDGSAAIQLLAILQREGRLLDFLQEDVDAYSDAQIGAAVRDIHRGCRKSLHDYLTIEPIIDGAEEQRVTVPGDFDPAAVRLVGNVNGSPPFQGILKHHGWRVRSVHLPLLPVARDHTSLLSP